ncbi:hypothetical protein ACF0H5_009576 [Mactra antiquata]
MVNHLEKAFELMGQLLGRIRGLWNVRDKKHMRRGSSRRRLQSSTSTGSASMSLISDSCTNI